MTVNVYQDADPGKLAWSWKQTVYFDHDRHAYLSLGSDWKRVITFGAFQFSFLFSNIRYNNLSWTRPSSGSKGTRGILGTEKKSGPETNEHSEMQ